VEIYSLFFRISLIEGRLEIAETYSLCTSRTGGLSSCSCRAAFC